MRRIFWLVLLFVACVPAIPAPVQIAPFEHGDFAKAGLDGRYWQAALQEIRGQNLPIDGITMTVNQTLIAEAYFAGYSAQTPHDLRSATKSITSLLVGMAIDQGLLDVNAAITKFFPDHKPHPSWREPITIRDLLLMQSGLDCNDSANTTGNEENMYRSSDWISFFFAIPRVQAPRTVWSYCTAGVVLLGEIVARVSKMPLPEFAKRHLFVPLEILEARFAAAPKGVTDAGGHLYLTPQSLLKIGILMRDGGVWRGRRLVSRQWIEQSLTPIGSPIPDAPTWRYGYLWWLVPVRDGVVHSYMANGNGGQVVMVVPEFGLVVAMTGSAYNSQRADATVFGLMQRYLIPMARRVPFAATK
jgi:CubicO group peptidase (beta-lactamase class C family)